MSSNLRSRQYVFRNKQLTKEQYENELAKINSGSIKELARLRQEFYELIKNSLHKFSNSVRAVAATGDNLFNVKNAINVFDGYNDENVKHCLRIFNVKESYDITGSGGGELMYDSVAVGTNAQNCRFDAYGDGMQDVQYSDWCPNSSYLFGCSAIRKKSYCILNKQYSKEEYQVLVKKIIEQMKKVPYVDSQGRVYLYGEFRPIEHSTFAYNETIAQEYFPLTKEQALKQGYPWRDVEVSVYKSTISSSVLPDDIKEVKDEIVKEIIECTNCKRAYRVVSAEVVYLNKMKIALPDRCPECRYHERFALRNPIKLWHRQCMKESCKNEFETPYAPERKEKIYCESCYQQEVV